MWSTRRALEQVALPAELHRARPERLRLLLSSGVGKAARHARETVLGLVGQARHQLADGARHRPARGPPRLSARPGAAPVTSGSACRNVPRASAPGPRAPRKPTAPCHRDPAQAALTPRLTAAKPAPFCLLGDLGSNTGQLNVLSTNSDKARGRHDREWYRTGAIARALDAASRPHSTMSLGVPRSKQPAAHRPLPTLPTVAPRSPRQPSVNPGPPSSSLVGP